jgi:hypothetical protein
MPKQQITKSQPQLQTQAMEMPAAHAKTYSRTSAEQLVRPMSLITVQCEEVVEEDCAVGCELLHVIQRAILMFENSCAGLACFECLECCC